MKSFLSRGKAFSVWILVLILQSCSSQYVSMGGSEVLSDSDRYQQERYQIKQDRGPDQKIDGHKIEDVVPVYEPRSAAGNKSPYTVRGKKYYVLDDPEGYSETGIASWYGVKFHGHKTSNGEIFDMYKVSAAHKTLPIPSYVKVTNLDNGKSVIARVNDRGPFHDGRLIDLSYAGAVKLGYEKQGTARVKVEAITPGYTGTHEFFIQVGAFSSMANAQKLKQEVELHTNSQVFIEKTSFYRVKVGPMTERQAKKLQKKLARKNIGPPIIVRL
ncbi:septal ring lytic transglycosylase RlpA family protein [Gynuella sunshinyii]|uniref:Endolytic peptidoglycan transglycosylase RlpA n=1 Tax=Gynuella sunshinyii YC6258 TaxID=1445510 RepID=A0A0C5VJP9_9GAMM|nr:septal ring lytic transglycosylase RlpA family protein [Gynuella sunshinyii]AJQ94516.1 lipoprotein [Gynuella sunshinyii YC6258]